MLIVCLVWNNIKAPLIHHMEQMRLKRLDRERRAVVVNRSPIAVNVLRAYKISQLPFTEAMPEPVDFCSFPEVREVLELPNDIDVDESSFSEVVRLLPNIFGRWLTGIIHELATRVWQAEKDEKILLQDEQEIQAIVSASDTPDIGDRWQAVIIQQLAAKFRQAAEDDGKLFQHDDEVTTSEPDPPDSKAQTPPADRTIEDAVEKMKLATTVFKCRRCAESLSDSDFRMGNATFACHRPPGIPDAMYPLFYPQILGHRCLTIKERDPWYLQSDIDPVAKLFMDTSPFTDMSWRCRQKWDCLCLAVDTQSGQRMEKIVVACGLDPATATSQDMDEVDARLGCPDCLKWLCPGVTDTAKMNTYGWRSAVSVTSFRPLRVSFSYSTLLL